MPLRVNPETITAKLRLDPNFSPEAPARKEVATAIQDRLRQSDIQTILKASSTSHKDPKFQVTILRDGTILKSQEGTKTQRLGSMNADELFMKLYPKPASIHPLPEPVNNPANNEVLTPPLDPSSENTGPATIHLSPTELQNSDTSITVNTIPGITQSAIHTSPLQQNPGSATIYLSPTSVIDPHDSTTINSRRHWQESDDDSTFGDAQDNPDQQESAIIYTSPFRQYGEQTIQQHRPLRYEGPTDPAAGFLTINTNQTSHTAEGPTITSEDCKDPLDSTTSTITEVPEHLTSEEDLLISHYSNVLQNPNGLAYTPENARLLNLLNQLSYAYNEDLISQKTLVFLLRNINNSDLSEKSANELMTLINSEIYNSVDVMYRQLHQQLNNQLLLPVLIVVRDLLDLLFNKPQLQNVPLEVRALYLLSIKESTKSTVSEKEALLQLRQLKEALINMYLTPAQSSMDWEEPTSTNSPKAQPKQADPLELARHYFKRYQTTNDTFYTNPSIPHAEIRLHNLLAPVFNAEYMGLLSQPQLVELIQTIDTRSAELNDELTFTGLKTDITAQLETAASLNHRRSHKSFIATLLPPATTTSSADSPSDKPLPPTSRQQPYSSYDRRFHLTIKPKPPTTSSSQRSSEIISFASPRAQQINASKPETVHHFALTTFSSEDFNISQTDSLDETSIKGQLTPQIAPKTSAATQTNPSAPPYRPPPAYNTLKFTSNPLENPSIIRPTYADAGLQTDTPQPEPISKEQFRIQLMELISPVNPPFYNTLLDFITVALEKNPPKKFDELKNEVTARMRAHYAELNQLASQKSVPPIAVQPPLKNISIQTEEPPMPTITARDAQTSPIPIDDADMQPALAVRSISSQYEVPVPADKPDLPTPPTLNTFQELYTQLNKKLDKTSKDQALLPVVLAISKVTPEVFSHINRILITEILEETKSEAPFKIALLYRVQLAIEQATERHHYHTQSPNPATMTTTSPQASETADDIEINDTTTLEAQRNYQDLKNIYIETGKEDLDLLLYQFLDTWINLERKTTLMSKVRETYSEANENPAEALKKLQEKYPQYFPFSTCEALTKKPVKATTIDVTAPLEKFTKRTTEIFQRGQAERAAIELDTANLTTMRDRQRELKQGYRENSLLPLTPEFLLLQFLDAEIKTTSEKRLALSQEITKRRAHTETDSAILADLHGRYPQFFPEEESHPTIEDKPTELPADSLTKDV